MSINFQSRAWRWAKECFGPRTQDWSGARERANRFCEEALELCQALDMSREDAHQIVDYVYSRTKGEVWQEVGGTMVTLAVLCNVFRVDMDDAAIIELDRCWHNIERIRQKQAAKKKDSALPAC